MNFRVFTTAIQRAMRSIRELPFLHLVTVGMISYSLLLVSTFLLIVTDISDFIGDLGGDIQVTAYLRDDIPTATIFEIKAEIEGRAEVEEVRYVSRDEALAQFVAQSETMAAIIEDLGTNPLPASLEMVLKPEYRQPEDLETFVASIGTPEFEDLTYAREGQQRAHVLLRMLRIFGFLMGMLLIVGSIFVIGNTIQLAIYARREEVVTARLVGATGLFVELPFVIEGVMQGLLGAGVAVSILAMLYRFVLVRLQDVLGFEWAMSTLRFLPTGQLLLIFLAGVALGVAGSLFSLRRFLGDEELL